MDTALSNGDFLVNSRGRPISISGVQEILQRVLITLSVRKGSFIYDLNLGSDLYKLKFINTNLQYKAFLIVREALLNIPEVKVENVKIDLYNNNENMNLTVFLTVNNQLEEVAIKI